MPGVIQNNPKVQFFGSLGVPLANGTLTTYVSGSSTPATTWQDSALSIANTNPITLDGNGECLLWLDSTVTYRFVLKTALGVTRWDVSNITGAEPAGLRAALAASGGSAMVGFLQAGAGAIARTVQSKLRDSASPKDFGATGDGVTNDAPAMVLANAAVGFSEITIPAGTYVISSNTTFTKLVRMMSGAVLNIPNGVTVAFNGGFEAGVYQVFNCTGTGAVTFDASKTRSGYAEWWGAVTGGPDCTAAINAALIALPKTELMPADYWTTSRLLMGLPFRELAGAGSQFDGTNSKRVTRILLQSATADILQVGPDAYPGSVNALYKGNYVHDIYLVRTIAPNVTVGSNGVKNIYTLYARLENIKSEDSVYGFQFYGTVQTYAERCFAFRQTAGTGGTDIHYGFYVNGAASIGLNSGNASLFLNYCNATIGGISIANSNGFYFDSGYTDAFVESPETSGHATGINIQGNGSAAPNLNNIDLQIKNPILDSFTYAGILVNATSKFGAVTITGGYYGAGAGATAGIYFTSSLGSVVVQGGQIILNSAATAHGVLAISSNRITVDKTIIKDGRASGVELSDVNNCTFNPIVQNDTYSLGNAAVRAFGTCTRNQYSPTTYGGANSAPIGVQLVGAAHGYNEIHCSGMDPAGITGGSNNKLVINGVQVTAVGLSGTNYASGVMA